MSNERDYFWPIMIAFCFLTWWGHDTFTRPQVECQNNLAKFCPNAQPFPNYVQE